MIAITSIKGIGPNSALLLKKNGFASIKDIAEASIEQLQAIPGFGAVRAALVIKEARRLLAEQAPSPAPTPATPPEPELIEEPLVASLPELISEIEKEKKLAKKEKKAKKKAKKEEKKKKKEEKKKKKEEEKETGIEKSPKKEKKNKKGSDKKKKKE
ncbi:MAG: helix-hairpin-helix domain-containing protein [Proteobacteria bacterium]|nr:helix-hairpin-helix domain-containing protein [Pseudomonadota bacterium]MBU1059454.1 helix-hairpin-helix domain-containing protein [Pseudomonadota bacterium]